MQVNINECPDGNEILHRAKPVDQSLIIELWLYYTLITRQDQI